MSPIHTIFLVTPSVVLLSHFYLSHQWQQSLSPLSPPWPALCPPPRSSVWCGPLFFVNLYYHIYVKMWIFNWSFFSPWRQVPHCLPPLYISVSVFSLRLRPGQSAANNLFGRDVQLPPRGASGNSGQICGVQWAEAAPRIKKREEVKKFEIFYIGFQFYAFRTDCNERGWEETFVSSLHSRYLKSNMLEMEIVLEWRRQ